ncbi:MAG: group II intron reverse transcriptase/maturase [Elusimicrobiota bacterium]
MKSELPTLNKVRELQRKLYLKSKAERKFRFYSLYDKVCRLDILEEAWKQVRTNKGACGVDDETIGMIEATGAESFLKQLQKELISKTYQPQTVKRVWIPKADGSQRPLGIPTVKDRVVQTAVKIVIEPIFEANFQYFSYGFRPKRSTHQAVKEVVKFLNWGLVNVIDADISDYFNNISHSELLKLIAQRIVDKQILWLIKQWLKCGVLEEGKTRRQITGTPQGGVISPLLANIYLNVLDKNWQMKKYPARNGLNAHLIRYADDLLILTNKSATVPLHLLEGELKQLGLELNSKKTRIISAEETNFDFLGFSFRKTRNKKSMKKFALFFPTVKAQKTIRAKIREITRNRPVKVSEVVEKLNPVLRGWVNYFRIGNSARVFNKIKRYADIKVRGFIRRRQVKDGYGWKEITSSFLYGNLGLYYDWRVVHE